jgi:dolichol-phosphate mannosyltransferase
MSRPRPRDPLLSVVVPVLDEADCVGELVRRVHKAVGGLGLRTEILFVDDGSRDETPERIAALRRADPGVRSLRFTRSFGHQAALAAGLRHARGDAVVTLDGDLQHPPELLPELVAAWRAGADVVQAVRRRSPGASRATELLSRGFYRAMAWLSRSPVVPAAADFRLLDRRAVDAFNALDEHFLFVRGLVPWLGYRQARVEYDAEPRFAGESKYRGLPSLRLALDGMLAFSTLPLRLIGMLGFLTTLAGMGFGVFALVAHVTGHVEASGWTSVVVLILTFGGIQLLSVGIVSEYVGRIYEEVKRRPRYVIESTSDEEPR